MTAAEKECLDAFDSGKKEQALKLLPKLYKPETVIKSRTTGWTLIHHAAYHGWGDVCKLLVEKYNCEPTAVSDSGKSPLHIACWFGQEKSVKYLVTLPSVLRRINDKDPINGRTPLQLACKWGLVLGSGSVIKILLETNAVSITEVDKYGQTPLQVLFSHPYDVLANKIDWSIQLPVKPFFSVFLVGNSGAGKSTLAAAMLELSKDIPTQHGRISNVEELTAGIVPTQCIG